jgi:prepilin-type N-terminal cleavage/methylation domain-containing protein
VRNRKPRRRRGFSLIEVLIVVAIMGILVLVGMPNLMSIYKRAKLTGTAQEAVTLLRKARYEAIRRATAVCVASRAEGGQIVLGAFLDLDADCVFDSGDSPVDFALFTIPDGVRFEGPAGVPDVNGFPVVAGHGRVSFAPTGVASATGAFRIALLSQTTYTVANRDYLEIRIPNVNSGKVEVRKYNGGQWYRQDQQRWVWHIS